MLSLCYLVLVPPMPRQLRTYSLDITRTSHGRLDLRGQVPTARSPFRRRQYYGEVGVHEGVESIM